VLFYGIETKYHTCAVSVVVTTVGTYWILLFKICLELDLVANTSLNLAGIYTIVTHVR